MGINQRVLRHKFIWLKMTIIIIPLVWKLRFFKDISRPSSSLHVHLVPLYCYYEINVLVSLHKSHFIWIFYNQAIPPSMSPICFQKPPFQAFQRYSFQFTFLPTSAAKSHVTHPSIQGPWPSEQFYYPIISSTHFSGLLLDLAFTTPPHPFQLLTLLPHFHKPFLSISPSLLPAIIPPVA